MTENEKLQVFEDQTIRTAWDEEKEEWYFSVVDVVVALTESPDYKTGRKYWNKLKQRLKEEGNELVTNCHQLNLKYNIEIVTIFHTFKTKNKIVTH